MPEMHKNTRPCPMTCNMATERGLKIEGRIWVWSGERKQGLGRRRITLHTVTLAIHLGVKRALCATWWQAGGAEGTKGPRMDPFGMDGHDSRSKEGVCTMGAFPAFSLLSGLKIQIEIPRVTTKM